MAGVDDEPSQDDEKREKRRRVSQACEPCRIRKSKCDGRQPICSLCEKIGAVCAYEPNPKKRGLRPGQVSALQRRVVLTELIASFLMSKVPAAEDAVANFFVLDDAELKFLRPGERREELDQVVKRWRQGPVADWLYQTAARSDSTLDQLSRYRLQGVDGGSTYRSDPDGPEPLQDHNLHIDARKDNRHSAQLPARDYEILSKDRYTLPSNTTDYFDYYFAYTHTWLPLIDKYKLTEFIRNYNIKPRELVNLNLAESANLTLVWAVIALAAPSMPDINLASNIHPTIEQRREIEIATSLIPHYDKEMNQEHIQAIALLALAHFYRGTYETSWIMIGVACRVATDMSSTRPGQHIPSSARRTSLACFVIEGIIASALNRNSQAPSLRNQMPGTISDSAAASIVSLEEDGWEEWSSWEVPGQYSMLSSMTENREPFRILSTFNLLVRLTEILKGSQGHLYSHTNSAAQEKLEVLNALMQSIRESHPFLDIQSQEKTPYIHILSLHSLCLLIRFVASHAAHSLGSNQGLVGWHLCENENEINLTISSMVEQYLAFYPKHTAPLPIIAVLVAAQSLLPDNNPSKAMLMQHLFNLQPQRATTPVYNDFSESIQSGSNKRPSPPEGVPMGNAKKQARAEKNLSKNAGANPSPNDGAQLTKGTAATAEQTNTMPLQAQETDNTLALGFDYVDTASISLQDLAALDSSTWNDDFARNLGYACDQESTVDPELLNFFGVNSHGDLQ